MRLTGKLVGRNVIETCHWCFLRQWSTSERECKADSGNPYSSAAKTTVCSFVIKTAARPPTETPIFPESPGQLNRLNFPRAKSL